MRDNLSAQTFIRTLAQYNPMISYARVVSSYYILKENGKVQDLQLFYNFLVLSKYKRVVSVGLIY
jgi:hypothetical protein